MVTCSCARIEFFPSFADAKVEDEYAAYRRPSNRVLRTLEVLTWCTSALFLFLWLCSPTVSDSLYRVNNVASSLYISVSRKVFFGCIHSSKYYSSWYNVIAWIWCVHHLLYQSLSHRRAENVLAILGLSHPNEAQHGPCADIADEAYQILWCCACLIAFSLFAGTSVRWTVALFCGAPLLWLLEVMILGSSLSIMNIAKHFCVYAFLCVLAFLGAYQIDLDRRQLFFNNRVQAHELLFARAWDSGWKKVLATNFDCFDTLDLGFVVQETSCLQQLLGDKNAKPLQDFTACLSDRKRLQDFLDLQRRQVSNDPDRFHGPNRINVMLNTLNGAADSVVESLWIPGVAKPERSSDSPASLGAMWIGIRRNYVHDFAVSIEEGEMPELQSSELVTEKIMQCKAEFAKEDILSASLKYNGEPDTLYSSHCESLVPSNVQSAPPILASMLPDKMYTCSQEFGDCLPSHSMVWTEGAKVPKHLSSLTPGDRILCYDNLAKTVTYATIDKLQQSSNVEWVKLSMQDGSMLQVTTDHPVSVRFEFGNQRCMRAGDLKAGRDHIMILKMAWVPISDICYCSCVNDVSGDTSAKNVNAGSITISVEQKERHEIFVTTGDKHGNPGPPIAVGSSDRSMDFGVWRNKNTFLHLQTSDADEIGLRRSYSDPGLTGSRSTLLLSATTATDASSTSMIESVQSSSMSRVSNGASNQVVKIGRHPYDDPISNIASLSAFQRLEATGIPSCGSDHPPHMCVNPCSFHFASLLDDRRRPCTSGALCEYCHDSSHQPKMSSRLKRPRPKRHATTII